ncbi:hypothetical protein BpHYR1_038303 [Brachionus plicatilis]|uniref:Uncharacterized protein n=1 Tax=Brachionus plicatilis TaxID=10195 RepID=A0A3M7SHQ9_BRAPC|nr:hypothetical protein BpHYR1_038303 [Brachionus plicatilis]
MSLSEQRSIHKIEQKIYQRIFRTNLGKLGANTFGSTGPERQNRLDLSSGETASSTKSTANATK